MSATLWKQPGSSQSNQSQRVCHLKSYLKITKNNKIVQSALSQTIQVNVALKTTPHRWNLKWLRCESVVLIISPWQYFVVTHSTGNASKTGMTSHVHFAGTIHVHRLKVTVSMRNASKLSLYSCVWSVALSAVLPKNTFRSKFKLKQRSAWQELELNRLAISLTIMNRASIYMHKT